MLIKSQSEVRLHTGRTAAVYTSTPADVPDPTFRFLEGLVPRLHGYLGVAPPLASHLFLPRITIVAIPPRYREAVTITLGHGGDCYTHMKQLYQ